MKIHEYISSSPSLEQIIYSCFLSTHHVFSAQDDPWRWLTNRVVERISSLSCGLEEMGLCLVERKGN